MKISIIGAGSITFCRKLVADILIVKEFNDIEISLMDINVNNLEMVKKFIEKDIKFNHRDRVKLVSTTNRKESLKNANYVINTVRIGGLDAYETDISIPLEYGVDQCVGDTLSAGGVMYGQRTISFILDLCRDIKEAADDNVLMLNYSNPNAMVTWAANVYGGVHTLGLCHGVQHGHEQLAEALDVPQEELDFSCVGINHITWYTELVYKKHTYTKEELIEALEKHPVFSEQEKVRIDMLKRFGYYSTESNGHLSEYLPWYRKRAEEIADWISTTDWIHGETGGYLRRCKENRNYFDNNFEEEFKKEASAYTEENRSNEHGSWIIEAIETGRIYRGHFNVLNDGIVKNLPSDCIVEVPCYVDKLGIHTPVYGSLPDGLASVCLSNINVQRLATKAAVAGDIELLKQAMLLDPLVGAVCNPPEVWQLVDELLVAQKEWLPQYTEAIVGAVERLKSDDLICTNKGYRGAVRL